MGNIFTEYTKNVDADKERFVIPEIGPDQKKYWPETLSMSQCKQKEIFSSRLCAWHCILYAALGSLQSAVYFIFSLIFGTDNERMIKLGLAKMDIANFVCNCFGNLV